MFQNILINVLPFSVCLLSGHSLLISGIESIAEAGDDYLITKIWLLSGQIISYSHSPDF